MIADAVAVGAVLINTVALVWAIFQFRAQRIQADKQREETRELLRETKKLDHKLTLLSGQRDQRVIRVNRLRELILQLKDIYIESYDMYFEVDPKIRNQVNNNWATRYSEMAILVAFTNNPELTKCERELSNDNYFSNQSNSEEEATRKYVNGLTSLLNMLAITFKLLDEIYNSETN